MINGIIGVIFFFVITSLLWWLIRKIADLVIGLIAIGSAIFIFIVGLETSLEVAVLTSLALSLVATVIIIPIVPISSKAQEFLGSQDEVNRLMAQQLVHLSKRDVNQAELVLKILQRLERLEKDLGVDYSESES